MWGTGSKVRVESIRRSYSIVLEKFMSSLLLISDVMFLQM